MKRIYLDHAATTPVDKRVAKAMRAFEIEFYGNPNSTHREGQNARAKIDTSRAEVAKFLNSSPQEIIFTSGATEANNLAIQGVVSFYINEYQIKPHVITTKLEHQSVYNTVKELEVKGVITATFIDPTRDGLIDVNDVIKSITANTVLISCIFVSNEIGSVLPVRELGKLISDVNTGQKMKVMYHIDAVQATKFYNCNVEKLNCDLLTLSAHKIYGPKGIGALFIKNGVKISNLMYGGSQEYGKRPGTQNSTGILGMAAAVDLLGTLEQRQASAEKIVLMRNFLIEKLKSIPNVELNGPEGDSRTADNVNFTIFDLDQDALMTAMDLAGIAASTGSACVSGSSEPSHVIKALGKIHERKAATIRLTLGNSTKLAEIKLVSKTLVEIINKLRL